MLPRLKNTAYFPSWVDDFIYTSPWTSDMEPKVSASMPTVNIKEDENLYILDVASPGMDKKDFKLEIIHNVLTISAEREEEKVELKRKFTRREFNYASFKRSFTLPDSVDKTGIGATYEKGILTITVPKKEEAKSKIPTQIAVK